MIDYRDRIVAITEQFSGDYESSFERTLWYEHSGFNLIEEINALNPKLVVDVGCGANLFKNKIKNLIGFDVRNYPDVDFNCAIEDMVIAPESADVILALGSLQYTNREIIYKDISKIVSWLRPGGFFVVRNKGFVSESQSEKSEYGYRWSREWFDQVSRDFGLTTIKGPLSDANPNQERIVWWWQKQ